MNRPLERAFCERLARLGLAEREQVVRELTLARRRWWFVVDARGVRLLD